MPRKTRGILHYARRIPAAGRHLEMDRVQPPSGFRVLGDGCVESDLGHGVCRLVLKRKGYPDGGRGQTKMVGESALGCRAKREAQFEAHAGTDGQAASGLFILVFRLFRTCFFVFIVVHFVPFAWLSLHPLGQALLGFEDALDELQQ